MAKSTKNLREFYGFLLSEDLVSKLSDKQISLLSLYYGSLSEKEKNKIHDAIEKDKSHDLLEMAQSFLEESQQDKKPKPPKAKKTTVKVSNKTDDKDVDSSKEKDSTSSSPGKKIKTDTVDNKKNKPKTKKTSDSIEVDERILKLLGLQDIFDIDGDYYLTLLKERLASARMSKSKIPVEEDELLVNEYKKVKRQIDKEKRYTIKKKKISSKKLTQQFDPRKILKTPKQKLLLTGQADTKEPEAKIKKERKDPLLENVIAIRKSVNNILSLLGSQNKIIKGESEKERRRKEREKRDQREKNLEKIKTAAFNTIKAVLAPVQDILDRIIKFLTFVILGRAVIKFLEWAGDPKNKSKLEALGNLLKTWWPALLGAFVLFTTPLGKFIRVVVGTITKITFQLLRKGIPQLRKFLKERDKKKNKVTSDSQRRKRRVGRNSKVTEGVGDRLSKKPSRFGGARGGLLGTLAFAGLEMATPFLSGKVGELYSNMGIGDAGLSDEDLLKEYKREKTNIERKTSGPFGGLLSQRTDYSRLDGLEEELDRRGIAYNEGGEVFSGVVDKNDGVKFAGAGPDTQAFPVVGGGTAVLKPGELVLNEQQQKNLQRDTGVDPRSYVADARPKQVSGKMFGYNSGGMIGGVPQGPFTPLPSPGYVRPQGSFIPKPMLALPGPMPGTTVPFGYNPFKGLKGGGLVEKLKNFASGVGNLFTGQKAKATSSKPRIPSWHGPAPIPDYATPQAKALLRTIRTAEHYKGKDPYTSIYGGGSAPITKMTVQEVINMGNTGKLPQRFGGQSAGYASGSAATGAYQFMPFTLNDLIRKGLVKPNEIMSPKLQDRLGWELASNRGVTVSGLKRNGLTQSIMDKMAPEWASFPYSPKGGMSYYDQPVKGSKFLNQIYQQSLPKKQGGGLHIKENTGMNIKGATADRQAIAAQPGEYMLPVDFVNAVGVPAIDKLVSFFDNNSNPAKINKNVNRVIPGPRQKNSNRPQMLPPITQSANTGMTPSRTPGSEVPDFNMICAGSLNTRSEQMSIYGIVG